MKTDIILLHYNNYFNRTVKKEGNYVEDYLSLDIDNQIFQNINFVPGDGVLTSLVLGTGREITDLELENFDYLLVARHYEPEDEHDEQAIISRWFIMNCQRTRLGQYQFNLKRDTIVDNYSAIIDAPIYIEKANISDPMNPLIFNKEGLNVNQIKQSEFPIQDETKSGWVVGYVPRDIQPGDVTSDVILPGAADITVNGLSSWAFWKNVTELNVNANYLTEDTGVEQVIFRNRSRYTRTHYTGTTTFFARESAQFQTNVDLTQYNCYNSSLQSGSQVGNPTSQYLPDWYTGWTNLEFNGGAGADSEDAGGYSHTILRNSLVNISKNSTFIGYIKTFLSNNAKMEFGSTAALRALDQKVLYDSSTNIYYRIIVKYRTGSEDTYTINNLNVNEANILNFINNNLKRTGIATYQSYSLTGNLRPGDVAIRGLGQLYYIELDQLAVSLKFTIPDADHRSHLEDAPYDMFCIPYSDSLQLYDGTDTFTCNKAVALSMATAIAPNLGSGEVYDVQLVPYCPCREAVVNSTVPDQVLDISGVSHSPIRFYSGSTLGAKYSAVIWCTRSIFNVDLNMEQVGVLTSIDAPYNAITQGSGASINTFYRLPALSADVSGEVTIINLGIPVRNLIKVYWVNQENGNIVDEGSFAKISVTGTAGHRRIGLYLAEVSLSDPIYYIDEDTYNAMGWKLVIYSNNNMVMSLESSENFYKYFDIATPYYFNSKLATPEDVKVSNECDMYRLSSGNYNGIFEFSMAKSYGIDGFKVECNYKPWSPYIHIVPKLKGLYGEEFINLDDARGLICGGDFSLTQLSNQWADYQLNNKTYQEMFDRQIKNLDVTQDIQRQQTEIGAVLGALGGGITGAAGGYKAGGGYGAIAGAGLGLIGSAVGGAVDLDMLKRQQQEQRSYQIDMYNYNLQNIQAIPSSITKTTALTQNTRIWPFLEYYTCTDVEKQAFRDKLKYNGMTVMAIGKMSDYIIPGEPHFLLGQIIRLPNLREDSHMANDIYEEITKGVYI